MRSTTKVLALAGLVIGIGGEATAQGRAPQGTPSGLIQRGPQAGPQAGPARGMLMRGSNVTQLLNARRALDLTPRQVAQLDSIERAIFAERQRVATAQRPAMDSMRARMRTQGAPDERQRTEMRAQAEARRNAMRPEMERLRRADSTASAAAERLLTDTQRAKWNEMRAERRGFVRGMQAGRQARPAARAPQGRPGMRRP